MPSLPAIHAVRASTQATVRKGRLVPASCRSQLRPPSVVWKMRPSSPTIQPARWSAKQVANSPCLISPAGTGVAAARMDPGAVTASRHSGTASGSLIEVSSAAGGREGLGPSRARFALSTARAEPLEHELELDADVVAVAQRAELARRGTVDRRVVERSEEHTS